MQLVTANVELRGAEQASLARLPCNGRLELMLNFIKRLFHHHIYTNRITVSGYGYTEYEVWFCKSCGKVFWKQTRPQQ